MAVVYSGGATTKSGVKDEDDPGIRVIAPDVYKFIIIHTHSHLNLI